LWSGQYGGKKWSLNGSSGNSARRFHKDVSRCVIMS
jgi:hypothetical protein